MMKETMKETKTIVRIVMNVIARLRVLVFVIYISME